MNGEGQLRRSVLIVMARGHSLDNGVGLSRAQSARAPAMSSRGANMVRSVEYILWDMPKLNGMIVGACADPSRIIQSSVWAHAHSEPRDEYKGWICVKRAQRDKLGTFTSLTNGRQLLSEPAPLALHEYAHLECPGLAHGAIWQMTYRNLLASYNWPLSQVDDHYVNPPRSYDWPQGTRVACYQSGHVDAQYGTVLRVARTHVIVHMDDQRRNPWHWTPDSLQKIEEV